MRQKRGDIWISAVLYMALGIIVIALLLAASLPLIEKVKDRNTVAETKKLLRTMDESIKIVAKEGPGSQRDLSPLVITKGHLIINQVNDTITWQMKTTAKLMEPQIPIQEGALTLYLASLPTKDEYTITITLNYHDFLDLTLESDYQNPFTGRYSAVVRHSGTFTPATPSLPVIAIKIF